MTHHQFGSAVGDVNTGGIVDAAGSVLFIGYTTVAIDSVTTSGEPLPLIGLELRGRITKTQDTVNVVYLLPLLDAGEIAGALANAAMRIGETAHSDFRVGVSLTLKEDG